MQQHYQSPHQSIPQIRKYIQHTLLYIIKIYYSRCQQDRKNLDAIKSHSRKCDCRNSYLLRNMRCNIQGQEILHLLTNYIPVQITF